MARIAGRGVGGVAEMGNWRRQRGLQIEDRLAMAVQAGIGGEYRFVRLARVRALRHAGVTAGAIQAQNQVRAVSEIVWLRRETEPCPEGRQTSNE